MPLSDQVIEQIKRMDHDGLLRAALTPDAGVIIEAVYRLDRTTKRLTGQLIYLTWALVAFSALSLLAVAVPLLSHH